VGSCAKAIDGLPMTWSSTVIKQDDGRGEIIAKAGDLNKVFPN
jgi:hypothetical protein